MIDGLRAFSLERLEAGVGCIKELRLGFILLLMLLEPALELLLALFKMLLEEDALIDGDPKDGLDWGNGELAGVAIRVGVTSLLVMMATVVLLLPLDLTFGRLARNKLGMMTGVKVRLGLVKVNLLLWEEDDLAVSEEPIELLDSGLAMLEASVNSLSNSSRLSELEARLGVMEAEFNSSWMEEDKSASPDSSSGGLVIGMFAAATVGTTLACKENALDEVGTISLSSASVSLIDDKDVGKRLICSVREAGKMSVLVSSWLVMIVLSPSMEVVQ